MTPELMAQGAERLAHYQQRASSSAATESGGRSASVIGPMAA